MNVYDFDKTIYKKDSSIRFYLFCILRRPKVLLALPEQLKGIIRYFFRLEGKEGMKSSFFSFFDQIPLELLVQQFWNRERKNINAWYLKQKKPSDVIISASPEVLLRPICEELKVDLIATKTDRKGRLTGRNCKGIEKSIRFYEKYGETEIDEFYSDSRSDQCLAQLSRQAYLVKGRRIKPWT